MPGRFVWHCHIVEHEDNEMMRPYTVGPDFNRIGYPQPCLEKGRRRPLFRLPPHEASWVRASDVYQKRPFSILSSRASWKDASPHNLLSQNRTSNNNVKKVGKLNEF